MLILHYLTVDALLSKAQLLWVLLLVWLKSWRYDPCPPIHKFAFLIPISTNAFRDCSVPYERLEISDFSADCGKINFPTKKSSAFAIPHVRYKITTQTLVICGAATVKRSGQMIAVLKVLTEHYDFTGKSFSCVASVELQGMNGRLRIFNETVGVEG